MSICQFNTGAEYAIYRESLDLSLSGSLHFRAAYSLGVVLGIKLSTCCIFVVGFKCDDGALLWL